jgi:hypothetical protein
MGEGGHYCSLVMQSHAQLMRSMLTEGWIATYAIHVDEERRQARLPPPRDNIIAMLLRQLEWEEAPVQEQEHEQELSDKKKIHLPVN